jgi:hypothetical protein
MKNWLIALALFALVPFAAFAPLALAQNGVLSWQAITPQFGGDGTAGQVLTSGGKGNAPTWTASKAQTILTISTLATCTAANVGEREFVSNGATSPTWNGAVSATGAVFAPVTCAITAAATYGWVYA